MEYIAPIDMDMLLPFRFGTAFLDHANGSEASGPNELVLGINHGMTVDRYRITVESDGIVRCLPDGTTEHKLYLSLRVCLKVLMVTGMMYKTISERDSDRYVIKGPANFDWCLDQLAKNGVTVDNNTTVIDVKKSLETVNSSYRYAALMIAVGRPEESLQQAKLALSVYQTISANSYYEGIGDSTYEDKIPTAAEFVAKYSVITGDFQQAVAMYQYACILNESSELFRGLAQCCEMAAIELLSNTIKYPNRGEALAYATEYYRLAYCAICDICDNLLPDDERSANFLEYARLKRLYEETHVHLIALKTMIAQKA